MPAITLSDLLSKTKTYLQSSSFLPDADITEEIQQFMDFELPLNNDLKIFDGLWRFQTQAHIYQYQLPLDRYSGIRSYFAVNGIRQELFFDERTYYNYGVTDSYIFRDSITNGTGTNAYTFTLQNKPVMRGYKTLDNHVVSKVFFSSEDMTGASAQCSDDGEGILTGSRCSGTINYVTGAVTLNFTANVNSGTPIYANYVYYNPAVPFKGLFRGDGNILELRPIPNGAYVIDVEARVKPSVLINSLDRLQYNWLFDYIALGSARRIFTNLVNTEMLQRTEAQFNRYKFLVQNRSSSQRAAGQKIRTVYDDSILNYE